MQVGQRGVDGGRLLGVADDRGRAHLRHDLGRHVCGHGHHAVPAGQHELSRRRIVPAVQPETRLG